MLIKNTTCIKSTICALLAGMAVTACGQRDPRFALLGRSQGFLSNPVNNKVDILWVIDNSGTMGPKQTNLANSINSFMSEFVTKHFDYQIAVLTTDIRAIDPAHPNDPNLSGQDACVVGSPQIITPSTPNPVTALAANANVGFFGSADAHGLDAVELALKMPKIGGCNSGFLRSDAYLAVIEFSDADDNTTATADALVSVLDGIKPPTTTPNGATVRPYSVSAMVAPDHTTAECQALGPFTETGTKYMNIANKTGGVIANICQADFSAGLLAVSTRILEQTTAVRLVTIPQPSTIVVLQDGNFVPGNPTNGWTFDADTNSIIFHGTAIPSSAGVVITVNYIPTDIIR